MNRKFLKLVELMVDQQLKRRQQVSVKEAGSYNQRDMSSAVETLRDVVDDLLMHTEMLIDESYGDVDIETFKKDWDNITTEFENKFSNILNNLST